MKEKRTTPKQLNIEEHRLFKEFFDGMREQECSRTPEFGSLWNSAVRKVRNSSTASRRFSCFRLRGAVAGIAGVCVLVAALFLISLYQHDRNSLLIAKAESLTLWEGPTTTLLSSDGSTVAEREDTSDTSPENTFSLSGWEAPSDVLLQSFTGDELSDQETS